MAKSKSSRSARVASLGGLPRHPGLNVPDPLLAYRLGSEDPLRLPDAENAPSAATVLKSEYTVSSDAAGHAVFGEHNALSLAKCSWVVTGGVAGVGTYVAHPQQTAFVAEARVARLIGMKIVVTYIGAEQEAAGYLSFVERVVAAEVDTQQLDTLHTGSMIQVRASEGLVVHVDYTQPPRYEGPASATFMVHTFPTAVFVASGLPVSKPLFRVRVSRFVEFLPVEGALAEGEVLHEPHNPAALAAHGELGGPMTSVTAGTGFSDFLARVRAGANAAYHIAQPVMQPYLVGKAREYLSSSMARYAAPMLLGM